MNDESKPINKSSQRSKLKVKECKVEPTELGFVTAIHLPTKTFFLQLCKFSHEELADFNRALNDYGNEKFKLIQNMSEDEQKSALKTHKGDIVLAKYPDDSEASGWYRALILSRDKVNRTRTILYLDYGDVVETGSDHMFIPNVEELPVMTRSPFGVTCFFNGSETYDIAATGRLLSSLMHNYVMIKIIESQSKLQHLVNIPKNAYNLPFWVKFQPETLILPPKPKPENQPSSHSPNTTDVGVCSW